MPDVFISTENSTPPSHNDYTSKHVKNVEPKSLPYFSSFCRLPEGISFESQETNERIILFLRRHFITNILWIILSILLLLLPPFILTLNIFTHFIDVLLPFRFLLIISVFYYLLIAGFVFNKFISWFYNFGIITNEQIVDVDFKDIMYRTTAKARIQDVIDVEFEQGGFLHSFFDYGNIFIQTEGVKPNFEFHAIPFPDKVSDIILDLKEKANVNT